MKASSNNLVLLLLSLFFCFFVLEIVLRLFGSQSLFHAGLDFVPHRKMIINTQLLGSSKTTYHSTNEWGFRGDAIPKDWARRKTILTIGGSTTQDFYLSDDKTWSAQLQKLLIQNDPTVTVQNAGLAGHSTRGHLLLIKTVLPVVSPKMVILLVGLNDLRGKQNSDPYEKTGFLYNLFARTKTLQWLYKWYRVFNNDAYLVSTKYNQGYPPNLPSNGYVAKPISCAPRIDTQALQSISSPLDEFKNNIESIIDITKEKNIKIIFLTQPLLFLNDAYWNNIKGDIPAKQHFCISAATIWKQLNSFNRALLNICQSKKVPCFDLANAIPHRQEYFYDHAHFSDAGAELAAKEIFQFMTRDKDINGWIKSN